MSKHTKNDSTELINEILKNESSVDLDKVEYWTGNNKRSEFEEYRRLKDAENHLEMTNGLSNADGLTDVLATTLEFNSKEKGNDVFFEKISQTIPKHDYLDKYPPFNDIKMAQKDNSDDMDNDVKGAIYEDFKENTSDINSIDEEIYEDFKENTSDINSIDEEIYEDFKENASDITSTDEEIYEDFKENALDITSTGEEIYEDFKENASDITSTDEEIYEDFKENALDITSTGEEIYEDFKENTSDITGQTDSKEDLDELNYDLKP